MTHAPLVEFPLAPLTPIMVSFMVCKESRRFVGSYEARPEKGDVVAFIPYLDLPHYALDEERAIAFIDSNGFRGWIAKDDSLSYSSVKGGRQRRSYGRLLIGKSISC
jgi:hypothetical protein